MVSTLYLYFSLRLELISVFQGTDLLVLLECERGARLEPALSRDLALHRLFLAVNHLDVRHQAEMEGVVAMVLLSMQTGLPISS